MHAYDDVTNGFCFWAQLKRTSLQRKKEHETP
jgi:hypothetical protein